MYRSGCRGIELAWLKRLVLVAIASIFFATGLSTQAVAAGGDSDSGLFSKFQSGRSADVVEVSPPEVIQELRPVLSSHQPQVAIISPKADQVVEDNAVSVKLQVEDLPIFQNSDWGLGPHLTLFIDDQPGQMIYDLTEPVELDDLKPGTHTLRALAMYPWLESFKNSGAFAEVTFHVFTKTRDNQPIATQPLLTYNQPQDRYGAEPVMLDFYVSGLPNAETGTSEDTGDLPGQVRVTVNDSSFLMEGWKTLYLEGLNPGKNWVRLELLDEKGDAIANAYNDTVRLIDLQPDGQDSLAQILRGDVATSLVRGIVDPDYTVPVVEPESSEPVIDEQPELNTFESDTSSLSEETAPLGLEAPDLSSSSDAEEQMTPVIEPPEELQESPEIDKAEPLETETSPQPLGDFDAIVE